MKRISTFICLCVFSAAFLALSCSRNPELGKAERLLQNAPDSALVVLDGIQRDALSPRDAAKYDYLSSVAFYKNYFFLDDAHSTALARAYRYKETQRSRMANLVLLIAAVLATLVLYFWARKAQLEKQLLEEREAREKMMSLAEDLKSRLGALQQKSSRKGGLPIDALDRLCEQYYVYEGTENLQPRILKEVTSIVQGLRTDASAQKALEQSLDEQSDRVMARLRAAFPKWKEEDYLLYLFAASGFSSTTISTLLEKDKPYVYNRLYRLKERIKSSDTPDKDFLLSCLGK